MSLTTEHAKRKKHAETNGQAYPGLLLARKVATLRKGVELANLSDRDWQKWWKHLHGRKGPPSLAKLTNTNNLDALQWELPASAATEETVQILQELSRTARKKASAKSGALAIVTKAWLAERAQREPDLPLAIECLAWAHSLAKLDGLGASQWCELLNTLLHIAEQAAGIDVECEPVLHQLLAGELPLTLASVLPEVEACRQLVKPSRAALNHGATCLLDGAGEISAERLDIARSLLACWTRCAALGKQVGKQTFRDDATLQLEWFVRQSLAMMRPDGSQMLGAELPWSKPLLATALKQLGSSSERKLAKLAIAKKQKASASSDVRKRRRFVEASAHSEWASTALLRASWQADSPRMLLDYSSDALRSELCVDRRVIWSGDCSPRVRIDGGKSLTGATWQEICWHCDEDVVYLEMETALQDGWKCQRQFVLDRENRFLLIGDAILGDYPAQIEYSCAWPTADRLTVVPEKETTECALADGKKSIARVLPLALPEWKRDASRAGTLEETNAGLHYTLQSQGKRMYAPLCFDLDPSRMKYPYTWRRLSVGRELEPTPLDEAVGYRVQLRLDQWLVYRSLAKVTSRTVLGQNYFYEFACGRFERTGEVEPLIEVE